MEEEKLKNRKIYGVKTIQNGNEEYKYYNIKEPKNRTFFNSVTGEIIQKDCENEEDMYFLEDSDKNFENKIINCADLNQTDELFFKIWNDFMKDKDTAKNMQDLILEFISQNFQIINDYRLKKNLMFHLVVIFENKQLTEENIINIINFFNNLQLKYK